MSVQWQENPYTFYGKQSLSHTARRQAPGSMECWAYCLGAVAGMDWSSTAQFSALDDMIKGQDTAQTYELVESINKANGVPLLRRTGRWYSPEWNPDQLKEYFPAAVAIVGHFVVALAIGKAPQRPDVVRYWDPADAQIHTVEVEAFKQQFEPEFSIAKAV
ncbi:hypothetical protein [Streptomyces sp. NBC_00459]|uniref:hypothetical protein n=1 Tax=Streptomyces sp. NBC_00459 TaxID=2975749 RepID=UPI002E198499